MEEVQGMHENQPVSLSGKPLGEAKKALILLHGRGATAQSILSLAEALGATEFAVLAPQAHMNQWYPKRFVAPVEQNEPYLSSALTMLSNLITKVNEAGISTENIVIAGFSQGACLAAEYVARNPQRYGGVLIFSGGLIGMGPTVFSTLYKSQLEGTPIFMGCSDVDAHIPLQRFEKSGMILHELGASVTLKVYRGMDHTIIQEEIEEAKKVLTAIP
jgi:predicted esterase